MRTTAERPLRKLYITKRHNVKRRGGFFILFFLFLAVSCIVASTTTQYFARKHADKAVLSTKLNPICVSSHLNGLSNSDLNKQLSLMKQAGIEWTRFDFAMDVIEPSQGSYNWASYDNIVNTAASYGVNIIALVDQYFIPNWANNTSDNKVPPSPSMYQNFAQSIAIHYAGKISLYEMGNEPNESEFWHPQWNAAAYTALLQAGYTGVKAVSSSNKVISAGLSNESVTDSNHSATMSFVQQMYANGAQGHFDYFGFHPYSWPASPDFTQSPPRFNDLDTIRQIMKSQGDGSKQIIATEVGWPSTTQSGGVTEAIQAAYINRLFQKILYENYQYVVMACVYDLIDDGTDKTNPEQNFGMLRADYSQKPAFAMLQQISQNYPVTATPIPSP